MGKFSKTLFATLILVLVTAPQGSASVAAGKKTFQKFNNCVNLKYFPQTDPQMDQSSKQIAHLSCSSNLPSFSEQAKMKKSGKNYMACVKARYMPQFNAASDASAKQIAYVQCSNLKP